METSDATFLIDCGPTVLQGMKRAGCDPDAIDFVLLSHLHGDHFGGLPFLFMEYQYERPRTRPFAVYGPADTERRVRAAYAALYEKTAGEPVRYPIRYESLAAGQTRAIGTVAVTPFAVPHVSDLLSLGFRLDVAGKSILYSGDSAWTEEFVTRSRGVDLFICECSTYETRLDIHVSYPEIAARAAALGCRRLVLSHLGSEPLRRLGEISLECARDGMTLDL